MSRPRSRSPLHSRTAALPGRIADGCYGEQYHPSVHSGPWRTLENVSKVEGVTHWDNSPSQGEEEVDHWAKFIEAIGHAGKRRPSPMSRYHIQGDVQNFEEKSSHSPRRLPRERLSSPDALPYGTETHQRISSPGQRRKEPDFIPLERHFSRDSSPRHLQGKRQDRMEHGFHLNEGREDRYQERSSFSESHLGYSSERQLSLDLVNVGRQRLDFLPLLKHSGTYRESAMHSGTFAQEIITLVHQVKENYFQGQGITLNERFSNEQHYSFMDEDEFTVEGQELKEMGPKINRPLSIPSSDTQIFCKIGSLQAQRRRQITDPGDLRYDLERRRQQRLEGVKITIAGGNFFQIGSQSQEIESAYVEEEDPHEDEDDFDWSEQIDPGQKLPARRNFKRFKNRFRRQIRNNPNDGASW
ncbi:hypothetical protein P4O66_005049 [Electrophorus voltai]|uniref:Uncharacterized protein n=1 Tax=Electrophorus voltai TaxID=2609070 RepID=A0AAD9A0D4_9TELE|nr:hypothetical protein P4O66_005049 [Electrophorus voltai]